MREDGGRDVEDVDQSDGPAESDGATGDAYWDETLLGGAGDERDADEGDDEGDDDDSGNVAGEFVAAGPVEPGTPDLENALFVVAGAYVAVLGLARLFVDLQGFDARDVLVLTGGTLLMSLVLMGFFGLLTPDT